MDRVALTRDGQGSRKGRRLRVWLRVVKVFVIWVTYRRSATGFIYRSYYEGFGGAGDGDGNTGGHVNRLEVAGGCGAVRCGRFFRRVSARE